MNSFNMKVSDLLKNPGQTDTIIFENIHTDLLPKLTEDWVSGIIHLQSINDSTIWLTLENVHCSLWDTCDRCLEEYQRPVVCEEYRAKFEIPNDEYKNEEEEENFDVNKEEIFPLNPKSESIDIEDMIVQAVVLQEPFIKKCESCKKIEEKENKENKDWDIEDNFWGGSITFS